MTAHDLVRRLLDNDTDPLAAVAAVMFKDDSLLLGKSLGDDARHGKWCFPGGGMAPDTCPMEAAARECEEESGIRGDPVEVIHTDGSLQYVLLDYMDGEPTPNNEFSEMAWIPVQDLRNIVEILPENLDVALTLLQNSGLEPATNRGNTVGRI